MDRPASLLSAFDALARGTGILRASAAGIFICDCCLLEVPVGTPLRGPARLARCPHCGWGCGPAPAGWEDQTPEAVEP